MNYLTFLDTAATASAAGDAQPTGLSMLLMLVPYLILLIPLYFLMIRPQNKKKKKEAEMKKNAQVGDEITTIGGISGRIIAVKDEIDSVVVETGADRSRLQVKRWAIGSVDTVHEDD